MSDGVDIVMEVRELRKRRTNAMIVLTEDHAGQKVWAAELAKQLNAQHVDLLEHFGAEKALSDGVAAVTVDSLFNLLCDISGSEELLVVSGLEFLRSVWAAQVGTMETLAHRVENWSQKPALVFVTQFDKSIEGRKSGRYGHQFVFNQKDTYALS